MGLSSLWPHTLAITGVFAILVGVFAPLASNSDPATNRRRAVRTVTVSPPQQRTHIGLAKRIPTSASAERKPIAEALAGTGPSPVVLALAPHLARAATGAAPAAEEQRLAGEVADMLATRPAQRAALREPFRAGLGRLRPDTATFASSSRSSWSRRSARSCGDRPVKPSRASRSSCDMRPRPRSSARRPKSPGAAGGEPRTSRERAGNPSA
ncbi:hypothetical protein AB0I28_00135 [Phytomonospora sp. NPDC050363]|uniref:hypothetical protein n=1 Tax=Phytomonospora sp. NPDC050363 TaxID=3155642 RepID=UPI0033DC04C0